MTTSVPIDQRPDRAEILAEALSHGLHPENIIFSVDEEGIDNADIFPLGAADDPFMEAVFALMEWAATTGAAMGFHFEPRGTDS